MQQKKRGLFRSTSRLFLRGANNHINNSNTNSNNNNSSKKDLDQLAVEAALSKAKLAVLHDSAGDIDSAIDAYTETVELLADVKDKTLIKIHDTYAQRIEVLAFAQNSSMDPSDNNNNKAIIDEKEKQKCIMDVTIDPTPSLCLSGGEESECSQPPTPSTSTISDPWIIHHLPSTSVSSSSSTTTTRTSSSSNSSSSHHSTSHGDLNTIFETDQEQQPFQLRLTLPRTITTSCFLDDATVDDDNDHDEENNQSNDEQQQKQPSSSSSYSSYYWTMMKRFKQSMTQGGYLTDRLYVPKQLWYNQQHRPNLPHLDHKLAMTEHLLAILKLLKQRQDPKVDAMRTLMTLQQLEETLIKTPSLSTAAISSSTAIHPTPSPSFSSQTSSMIHSAAKKWRASIHRQIQTASAWKNNKFVDRIRSDHSTPKMIDDRYHMYIRTLIKLFTAAQVLDQWHSEYSMDRNTSIHQQILAKIELCADMLGHIVCNNVLEDFKILWESWVNRGNQYMND